MMAGAMLASVRSPLTLALLLSLPLACSSGIEYDVPGGVAIRKPKVDVVDQDGMDDNWEKEHGLDPDVNDADADPDGDGLSNLLEWNLDTHPKDIDSDDDGLMDGAEDKNKNGQVDPTETNPAKFDTDGDGLSDGQELGLKVGMAPRGSEIAATDMAVFKADADPNTRTDPLKVDSDGDGIPDAVPEEAKANGQEGEDKNRNGRVDPDETNPMSLDSDNDGIPDAEEDKNQNGRVDPGETSAANPDSDGDGVPDGVELGITQGVADPDGKGPILGTDKAKFTPDADPSTKTDPNNADSDGDGVPDGDEDMNRNGKVDPGELNPESKTTEGGVPDGQSGKALVCTDKNLPQAKIYRLASANLALALPTGRTGDQANLNVSEVVSLKSGDAPASGFIFRDGGGRVGVVVSRAAMTAAQARTAIDGVVGLSEDKNRALTTWDGFTARLSAADGRAATAATPGDAAMAIAKALLGNNTLGAGLPASGSGSAATLFEVQYEVIQRSDENRSVITVGLRPASAAENTASAIDYNTDETPKLIDLVNTSVGRFGDGMGLRCDPMTASGNDVIDILWVVDNSGSMGDEQAAVQDAATEMVNYLKTTNLSWRLGLTTMNPHLDRSDPLHPRPTATSAGGTLSSNRQNGFTAVKDAGNWAAAVVGLGTGYTGGGLPAHTYSWDEKGLEMGIIALKTAVPATASVDTKKLREGANVLLVHMTDEEAYQIRVNGSERCPENATKNQKIANAISEYQQFSNENTGEGDGKIAGLTTFAITGVEPNPNWQNTALDLDGTYNPCGAYAGAVDCATSQYARGYVEVANAMGGGASSICGDMEKTVVEIMRAGAGIASSFELSQQPVSSSLRVVVSDDQGSFLGTDDKVLPDTPRSRTNGFDYAFEVKDGKLVHKIVFYGTARPEKDRKVMVGYRTWLANSTPAGEIPCDCPEGQVCHPDTNECEVDPTCGGECNKCNPETGLCGDPCGGQCVDGETCQDNGKCGPDPACCPTGRGWCDTKVDPWVCRGVE